MNEFIGALSRTALLGLSVLFAVGCSAPAAEDETTTSSDGLTLADGDRYVVSADPDSGHVVLRASVDGVPLPYDAATMIGKAILIHPLVGRAERGLYARVTDAREAGDRVEITTTPLTLEEMGRLEESEVLRIYLARSFAEVQRGSSTRAASLSLLDAPPMGMGMGGAPDASGWGGLFTGALPTVWVLTPNPSLAAFVGNANLARPPQFSFEPEGRLVYRRDTGLEVGLRGTLSANVAFQLRGTAGVRAEIFSTPEGKLPPVAFLVPIGAFPVPVQLTLGGSMRCDLITGGKIDGVVTLGATLRFGGSTRFNPSRTTPPSEWVSAGAWPYDIGLDFDASADFDLDPSVGIACLAPRINLDVAVAGITGPYLAVVPQLTAFADRAEARPSLRAGWSAGTLLFGNPGRVEIDLLSKSFTKGR